MGSQMQGDHNQVRAFIKEQVPTLFAFCNYVLLDDARASHIMLSIFREFGSRWKKVSKKRPAWNELDARILLFGKASQRLRRELMDPHAAPADWNRSSFKHMEEDLLSPWLSQKVPGKLAPSTEKQVLIRLGSMDPDYRFPLILRDFIRLEEQEVAEILNLRWNVYRHRLHRGRCDLVRLLRGIIAEPQSRPAEKEVS